MMVAQRADLMADRKADEMADRKADMMVAQRADLMATADGTALYRSRGEANLLLYIGISDDFGRRWRDHARKQPWWGEMQGLSVDRWYESRSKAEAAEKSAIKAEQPKYNKKHAENPSYSKRQRSTVDSSQRKQQPMWYLGATHPVLIGGTFVPRSPGDGATF